MHRETFFTLNRRGVILLVPVVILFFLTGCSVSKSSYRPLKKYSPEQLYKDYAFFQGVLEESHPGLYWYTPKEEMDRYFSWGKEKLKDSMTETEFRKVLTYVAAKINCGHTAIRPSKQFLRYRDSVPPRLFPLSLKIWDDTAAIAANLNRNDSILERGTVISKINQVPVKAIADSMFQYVSSDGNNISHKYQYLSNRGMFGNLFSMIYGLQEKYEITYLDSSGNEQTTEIKTYNPLADSLNRSFIRRSSNTSPSDRKNRIIEATRNLQIDTSESRAFMYLGSFGRNLKLRTFFKTSFRSLKKSGIKNLVIDVRGNGGGSVTNSTLLTRYITKHKFKVADSLYAINRNSKYRSHIEKYFFSKLFMHLFTKKRRNGNFHFGYFERHYFKPKKKNHFDGDVYILIGGNSFSATTLFSQTLKGQKNVIVVGEETGGTAYGNSAWLIPDATLPITKVRFRLPLFRLVVNKDLPQDGRGVQPEIFVKPSVDAVRRGVDFKTGKVIELIETKNSN